VTGGSGLGVVCKLWDRLAHSGWPIRAGPFGLAYA